MLLAEPNGSRTKGTSSVGRRGGSGLRLKGLDWQLWVLLGSHLAFIGERSLLKCITPPPVNNQNAANGGGGRGIYPHNGDPDDFCSLHTARAGTDGEQGL